VVAAGHVRMGIMRKSMGIFKITWKYIHSINTVTCEASPNHYCDVKVLICAPV